MGTKKRAHAGGAAIRKRNYQLRDLDAAGVQIPVWSLDDPPRTYDANVCGIFATKREITATFGQTVPRSSKVLNAVSITVPRSYIVNIMEGFSIAISVDGSTSTNLETTR